jgi:valyl-tRNA synthetase
MRNNGSNSTWSSDTSFALRNVGSASWSLAQVPMAPGDLVTPGHDKTDFEIGARHKLPIVDVLTPDGRVDCPAVPELHGLDRFEARKKAAELLQDRQLLSKIEPYQNNVGFSDRSEVPIEPRVSQQWFLEYPNTEEALAVVRVHLIRFFPQHWEKVYVQWLENIRDWCISRQIWW